MFNPEAWREPVANGDDSLEAWIRQLNDGQSPLEWPEAEQVAQTLAADQQQPPGPSAPAQLPIIDMLGQSVRGQQPNLQAPPCSVDSQKQGVNGGASVPNMPLTPPQTQWSLQNRMQPPPGGRQPHVPHQQQQLAADNQRPRPPSSRLGQQCSSGSGDSGDGSMPSRAPGSACQSPQAGNGPEADPEVAKLLRRQRMLQDKNRRAQARFRERQKDKMSAFEAQIARLNQRVAQLELERTELASTNQMLQKAASALCDTASAPAQAAPLQPQLTEAQDEEQAAGEIADLYNLLSGPDQRGRVCSNDVLRMDISDHVMKQKELVQEAAALLLAGAEDAGSPAGRRLAAIIACLQKVIVNMCTKRPKVMRGLEAGLLSEPLQKHGPPTADHWRSVMNAMRLSDRQRAQMLEQRDRLLDRMAHLMAQRRDVIAALTASMPTARDDRCNAVGFVKASQASEQLRRNLEEESEAVTLFLVAWHTQILSPLQHARNLVESYPWVPDALGICNTLAADAGADGQKAWASEAATWLGGLYGGGGAGLLPPGSAFRLLSTFQGAAPKPLQQGVASRVPDWRVPVLSPLDPNDQPQAPDGCALQQPIASMPLAAQSAATLLAADRMLSSMGPP